jgi:hypothetical protein
MLGIYLDSREAYKSIKSSSANDTHIKESKIIMDFNKGQTQAALNKYLQELNKGRWGSDTQGK